MVVRPEFRTGRMNLAKLTDQDWNFKALCGSNNAELIVPGWYEHGREWRLVRIAMWRWLRLEKPRAELFQRAKERNIDRKELQRAFLYYWQGVRWERHKLELEAGYEPDWPQVLRESFERDNPAAEKLLAELSDKYREVVASEYVVEWIESRNGAPRLRFVAKHLVKDTPWLLIPRDDRDNAMPKASGNPDTDGFFFFRALQPVESEDELQKLVRLREALPEPGLGADARPRIRWEHYTNREIAKSVARSRPQEWKHMAKGSGKGIDWWAALKNLAAMRLMHVLRPFDARYKFLELYGDEFLDISTAAKFDEPNFRKLRRKSIKTFQFLFDTDEEPRHVKTFSQRKRRG